MAKRKNASRRMNAVKVGAGVAAGIAGALAGAYILYARTKPQQKRAKAWVMKARKAASAEAKQLSRIGEKEYERIMEKAMRHYGAIEEVGSAEIASAISDAKAEWKHIKREAVKAAKAPRGTKKTAARRPKRRTARRRR